MTASLLVDTNILVYAYDRSEPAKQARALATLEGVLERGDGSLTTQILAEFFRAVTGRLSAPVPVADGLEAVEDILASWQVLPVPPRAVGEAARGVRDHGLPFWDALVWASAKLAGIPLILTEDLPGAESIEGVAYGDPLATGFDLGSL